MKKIIYKICIRFVGLVFFNLINNNFSIHGATVGPGTIPYRLVDAKYINFF